MKISNLIVFFFISTIITAQNVVINEVLYDPEGADTGYEWIELFNAGNQAVDLENWKLQKGGSEFVDQFTFPSIIIEPDSFLLIGEEFVPDTDITTSLAFQNGGSETDGIRIVSADLLYTDTVLYDSPNTNNLPDDTGSPGIYFAPDVSEGNTLARKHDGEDTSNCELDFFECEDPTPGAANFYPVDLEILIVQITEIEGSYWLEIQVFNLSTEIVDNLAATLEISLNDSLFGTYSLPEIPPESFINFSSELGNLDDGYQIIEAEVIYYYDNNLENNLSTTSIIIGNSPLVLNEIMFRPATTNQEWIEIFNRSACGYVVDNWAIIDAGGGQIRFSCTITANDFFVVCANTDLMLQVYPDIDIAKVVEASQWTTLNNTEESLNLVDEYYTSFDSTFYEGDNCPSDFSIERVNPFHDENITWLVSLDSLGTPALHNSVLPIEKDLELTLINSGLQGDQIEHSVLIKNIGLEIIPSVIFSCSTTLDGEETEIEIFQDEVTLDDSLLYEFFTEIPTAGYTTFIYEIYSSEDLNSENDRDYNFYNNNALPFVINEIMYDPDGEEPEWLEIKINNFIPHLEEISIVVDEDTLLLPFSESDYFLITSSEEDAQFLQTNYGLEENVIFTGLGSLSNEGEQLTLLDKNENLIESFFFLPEWNDELDGISIERVNPYLPATEENWGPSVAGCTPGDINSIYVELLPTAARLSVNPNPFSPYRDERTIISFKLPETISTVTIRIFDLKGRLVKKLVDQTLQASEGEIIWDGRDANSKNLPVGVYILLLEATSRESEKTYRKTTTAVIGK
ncbi:MAG: lamin tail domain-containing protein [Candidatus Cloacimonetes bacterium]|nr:lamin tail domain-containing protein [Candidatus Cloacimonadota bacterium]MBL7149620.1 lamin tail domain-containing protein [Candidatus Cloacimonadota bacterium]